MHTPQYCACACCKQAPHDACPSSISLQLECAINTAMADGSKLRYGFLHNHPVLMKRLAPVSLLPHLYAQGLVSENEKSLIQHESADGLKTDRILDIIHRQGCSKPQVYRTFFDLLKDDGVTSGMNLGEVVEKIERDALSEAVAAKFGYGRTLLAEADRSALLKHKWTIGESLFVSEVLPELVGGGVLSIQDKDSIKSVQVVCAMSMFECVL